MESIVSILIIIVCILLILVVLVQNSKGGGLASSFSSSNQVMGVRKTADFLEKATWSLAIALLALSIFSAQFNGTGSATKKASESDTRKAVEEGAGASTTEGAENAAPLLKDTAK